MWRIGIWVRERANQGESCTAAISGPLIWTTPHGAHLPMMPLAVLTTYHMQQMSAIRKKSFTAFHRILKPFVSAKANKRNYVGSGLLNVENLTSQFVEGSFDVLGVESLEALEEGRLAPVFHLPATLDMERDLRPYITLSRTYLSFESCVAHMLV